MPENSIKNQSKKSHNKNDPKDQRKPRQSRPKTAPPAVPEKKESEDSASANITQEPGPEFYKGLKRETDEILKITEESNAKYSSKEIQSNWKKYEVPIESYDEIEEQENLGADYAKLSEAPMSIGGHFQFKHEKSWDNTAGISEYDKYFDIYSEDLGTAICTIPFYERNDLDESMFSEMDLTGMKNRSVKYKQKYYNDKSYSTPDIDVLEKTNIIKQCISEESSELADNISSCKLNINLTGVLSKLDSLDTEERVVEKDMDMKLSPATEDRDFNTEVRGETKNLPSAMDDNKLELVDDFTNKDLTESIAHKSDGMQVSQVTVVSQAVIEENKPKVAAESKDTEKPVIESPEDLEKWLDDFLDS